MLVLMVGDLQETWYLIQTSWMRIGPLTAPSNRIVDNEEGKDLYSNEGPGC